MADRVQKRRGTTSQHSTFTGVVGEITVDTDKDTAVVHDGSTAGGFPLAREDVNNVSNPQFGGTSTLKVPTGTQAQRPVSPSQGQVRFNTDTDKLEYYANGTATWQATQETGTALFTGFAGSTITFSLTNNNKIAYPQTSTTQQNRIADAGNETQFSSRVFDAIESSNDFNGPGVTFLDNSFTLPSGVTVGLLVQWSADNAVTWSISQTGDWSGNASVAFATNANPQFYTATGPGTFTFGPFFRTVGGTGSAEDLDVDGIIIQSVALTANVSA